MSTPPDQAAQELRREINLTVMGNYPGTTASDQFIDDLLALMYRESLAVIGEDEPVIDARGLGLDAAINAIPPAARNDLRLKLRQAAALRYGQEGTK